MLGRAQPLRSQRAGEIIKWYGAYPDIHGLSAVLVSRMKVLPGLGLHVSRFPVCADFLLTYMFH